MKNKWQEYRIGSFLNRADRYELKEDLRYYTFSGTYSYAKGIFKSYSKYGSEFNLAKIQRIKKDDFVFCKIMAWEGAFGLVPKECGDTVMSGAFAVYEIDMNVVEPKFLDCFFKIEENWKKIGSGSTGTNVRRKTLHPDDFENLSIPLPPLAEQQRMVARIESIQSRIEQIRKLRAEQEKEIENLKYSYFKNIVDEYGTTTLDGGLKYKSDFITINDTDTYKLCRVQTKTQGVVLRETKIGHDIKTKKQQLCKTDDFIVAEMDARFGGYGIIPPELNNSIVSSHYFLYSINDKVLNKKYLEYFSQTIWFHSQVESKGSTNYAGIRPHQVLDYEIPLPPIDEQNRIVAFLDKVSQIRQSYKAQEAELSALMPTLLNEAFKGELVENKTYNS